MFSSTSYLEYERRVEDKRRVMGLRTIKDSDIHIGSYEEVCSE